MGLPLQFARSTSTLLERVAIGLVVITGMIHLGMGVVFFPDPLAIAFLLAGLGFGIGLVWFILNRHRTLLYLVGILFVGGQVIAWYVLNQPTSLAQIGPLEAVDKIVQLTLITVLLLLIARES